MMERLREDNTEFDRKVERFEKDNTERDQKVERLEKVHAELNHKMEQLQDNETLKIWIERLKQLEQENTKLEVQVEALHALVAASREHDPFIV
jgi:predicted RNase H-like nuclease (RuvC/YqgF family)